MAKSKTKKPVKAKRARYPWWRWADGKKHTLAPGKADSATTFTQSVPNMSSAIYGYARRHNRKASVYQREGKLVFVIAK